MIEKSLAYSTCAVVSCKQQIVYCCCVMFAFTHRKYRSYSHFGNIAWIYLETRKASQDEN